MFHRGGMWGGGFPGGFYGGYGNGSINPWYMWGHFIGMGIMLVAVIILAVILWRRWGRRPYAAQIDPALDILQIRYAKGEISQEEYQRIKEDLVGMTNV